jgi:hypothetical protein
MLAPPVLHTAERHNEKHSQILPSCHADRLSFAAPFWILIRMTVFRALWLSESVIYLLPSRFCMYTPLGGHSTAFKAVHGRSMHGCLPHPLSRRSDFSLRVSWRVSMRSVVLESNSLLSMKGACFGLCVAVDLGRVLLLRPHQTLKLRPTPHHTKHRKRRPNECKLRPHSATKTDRRLHVRQEKMY